MQARQKLSTSAPCNLAYVAGFFDGEGSVVITNQRGQLALNVVVVQTDRDVLEWIRLELGEGGCLASRSRKGSLGKKPLFVLQWSGAAAGRVLEKLLPYLKVKRFKAEIGIQFQATMSRKYCGKGVPTNVLQLRQDLRTKITA